MTRFCDKLLGAQMLEPDFEMPPPAWFHVKEINPSGDDQDRFFRNREETIRYLSTIAEEMQERYTLDDVDAPLHPRGRQLTVGDLERHFQHGLEGYDTRYEVLLCWFHYPA